MRGFCNRRHCGCGLHAIALAIFWLIISRCYNSLNPLLREFSYFQTQDIRLRKYTKTKTMIPCIEYGIGLMHKTKVAYFTWLRKESITIPDFSALVCAICGQCEYDTQVLKQLKIMLKPIGKPAPTAERTSTIKSTYAKRDNTHPPMYN